MFQIILKIVLPVLCVVCKLNIFVNGQSQSGYQISGVIIANNTEGIITLYVQGQWLPICPDLDELKGAANLICADNDKVYVEGSLASTPYQSSTKVQYLKGVICEGKDEIHKCHVTRIVETCRPAGVTYLKCSAPGATTSPAPGDNSGGKASGLPQWLIIVCIVVPIAILLLILVIIISCVCYRKHKRKRQRRKHRQRYGSALPEMEHFVNANVVLSAQGTPPSTQVKNFPAPRSRHNRNDPGTSPSAVDLSSLRLIHETSSNDGTNERRHPPPAGPPPPPPGEHATPQGTPGSTRQAEQLSPPQQQPPRPENLAASGTLYDNHGPTTRQEMITPGTPYDNSPFHADRFGERYLRNVQNVPAYAETAVPPRSNNQQTTEL